MIAAPPPIDQDDLPSLFREQAVVAPDSWRGAFAYVRKPNGWIAHAPTTIGNKRDYEGRGFRYLLEYGEFIMSPPGGAPKSKDARDVDWNPFEEPWLKILQMGGAKEFPIDQVIALHWHIRPPYRGVTFPQIDQPVHDFQCPECVKPVVFSSTNRREAARQLRVHLVSKIDEQHKYTVADLKELGSDLQVDFESMRIYRARPSAVAATDPTYIPPAGGGEIDLSDQKNPAFACPDCGWAPLLTDIMPAVSLSRHKDTHLSPEALAEKKAAKAAMRAAKK